MQLTQEFIKAIQGSIEETFITILAITPVVKIRLVDTADEFKMPIIASIGLTGKIEGSVVLLMSEEGACKATGKMLGTEYKEVTKDVLDAAGEIANILAGVLKTKLGASEYAFDISIPTVIHAISSINVAKLNKAQVFSLEIEAPAQFTCLLKFFYI